MTSAVLQILGAVLIVVAAFMVYVPVGLIVAGLFCILFGLAGRL
jgi:hypothetical protein